MGNALLASADVLARRGDRESAVAVYDRLREADLPSHIVASATRGAILARGAKRVDLLVAELGADDDARFASALGVARALGDVDVTAALVDRLPGLPPQRQALLIAVIGDRGDVAARPAILQAAARSPSTVRVAAIRALATLGDESTVGVLLEAAGHAEPEVASAALATLAALPGPEVDATVAGLIDASKSSTRRMLVELAGRRQIASAVPMLIKAADSPDEETRLAAVVSLGGTIGPEQMTVLTERLLAPADDRSGELSRNR